jgi:hypothetical protein
LRAAWSTPGGLMEKTVILDEQINDLLEEFSRRSIENAFRNYVYPLDEQAIVFSLAKRAKELGPAGIQDLRSVLLPESNIIDTGFAEGAARALAELEDAGALDLVIQQSARLWDACAERGGQIGGGNTFGSFLRAARKLMPAALKQGPLPDGVINTLAFFVQHISDWRAYDSVFETAACTASPVIRDELIQALSKGFVADWQRRSDALFALRHFPEMKASMMDMMGHPEYHMAGKAADAMVEMLGILPGCGERDFELWKVWAMQQVPPELRPKNPTGIKRLLKRKPVLDRRQLFFWSACAEAHEKAMRKATR